MYPYNYYKPHGVLGGFKNTFKNFSFNNFLDGCGKTLNVINQAIPVVQQIGPVVANAKTMFKIADIMKEDEKEENPPKLMSFSYTDIITKDIRLILC